MNPCPQDVSSETAPAMNAPASRLAPIAPGRLPGLGHLVPFVRNPFAFLQSVRAAGDLVRIFIGPAPVYVINSPELLNRLLVTDAQYFEKGYLFDQARVFMGNGLLTSNGDFHRQQRHLMQPAFRRERISGWIGQMGQSATATVSSWRKGHTIDVVPVMHELVLDILTRMLFAAGLKPEVKMKIRHAISDLLQGLLPQIAYSAGRMKNLPTPGNLKFRRATAELRSVLDELIGTYRADNNDRGDLFSLLCGAGEKDASYRISDEQVRDEVVSIIVAGSDSMANTLTWLCYELGQNPAVQERVRSELREVLGDRELTFADLPRLTYLQKVFDEILRLYTPNWILDRRTKNALELGEYSLPAGAEVVFSLSALHRDPVLYPDPLKFDPDRWSGDSSKTVRYAFIPFGTGRRKCIGDSLAHTVVMTTAATMFSRWWLTPLPGSTVYESKLAVTRNPRGVRMVAQQA